MPVFQNLVTLSFESDKERGWQVLPLLLNNSPNLETLAIKVNIYFVYYRHPFIAILFYINFAVSMLPGSCAQSYR